MKREVFLLVIVAFYFSFLGTVFAGDPPSAKFKLPAKFEGEQEIKKGIDTQKRKITIAIEENGGGRIKSDGVMFSGGWDIPTRDIEVRFEIEGETLIVSPAGNTFRTDIGKFYLFDIVGNDLKINTWTFNRWGSTLEFKETFLKRIDL